MLGWLAVLVLVLAHTIKVGKWVSGLYIQPSQPPKTLGSRVCPKGINPRKRNRPPQLVRYERWSHRDSRCLVTQGEYWPLTQLSSTPVDRNTEANDGDQSLGIQLIHPPIHPIYPARRSCQSCKGSPRGSERGEVSRGRLRTWRGVEQRKSGAKQSRCPLAEKRAQYKGSDK